MKNFNFRHFIVFEQSRGERLSDHQATHTVTCTAC